MHKRREPRALKILRVRKPDFSFGETTDKIVMEAAKGKLKLASKNHLEFLLKHQEFIPRSIDTYGKYLIALGTPVIRDGKFLGYPALSKSKPKGWSMTIVQSSDSFSPDGDKILIIG